MMRGFVIIPRRALSDPAIFSGKPPYSSEAAYLWLIWEARIKPTTVRVGGRRIYLGRSQLTYSLRFLAKKFGWSVGKVRRFINELEREHYIETDTSQGQLVITICDPTENVSSGQHTDHKKSTTTDTTADTQNARRKDIGSIKNKKGNPPDAKPLSDHELSAEQNRFKVFTTDLGAAETRVIKLIIMWKRDYGLDRTDRALKACMELKPDNPIDWVFSNIAKDDPDECLRQQEHKRTFADAGRRASRP